MANRYFFDKRDMKRGGFKYLVIFLIAFVPTVLFNVFAGKYIEQRWLRILLDCVILLVFVAVGNAIARRIYEKKDRELEARIKAREEMNERKRQILADSYNLKRIEKQKLKAEKAEEKKNADTNIDISEVKESDIVLVENDLSHSQTQYANLDNSKNEKELNNKKINKNENAKKKDCKYKNYKR